MTDIGAVVQPPNEAAFPCLGDGHATGAVAQARNTWAITFVSDG